MKIGISLLCAKEKRTGIENVALNLIRTLAEVDGRNEYVIFTNNQSSDWFTMPGARLKIVNVKWTFHRIVWFWEHVFFHLSPRRNGLDLVHFPLVGGVLGYRGKSVITIHDLNSYLGLHEIKLRERLLYIAWFKANIVRANRIITVSETVKNQILQHFPQAGEKVRVVYNGVDGRFKPLSNSASFIAQHNLPAKYMLFVGSSYASKNIMRLLQAFRLLVQNDQINHHLVIVGGPGYEDAKLRAYVKNARLEQVVHFGGYFPDADLPKLYSHASLLVFPTLAEGFGIPPVEAMACGTPVVASDIPVFHEVLGDSSLLVDPYSIESIAGGIKKVLTEPWVRENLIKKGSERAQRFTWKRMAEDMVKVYEEALQNNSSS